MGLRSALVDRGRVVGRVGQALALPDPAVTATSSASGALPAGTYWYVVTALTPGGETAGSAPLQRTLAGPGLVRLRWDAVVGASSYRVYRGPTPGALGLLAGTAATTFADDGSLPLLPGESPGAGTARGRRSGASGFSTVRGAWFRCRLQLPSAAEAAEPAGRRRTVRVPTLMYAPADAAGDPVVLDPEVRVELSSPEQLDGVTEWDVVSAPEPARKKRAVIAYTVTLRRVEPGEAEMVA